MAARADTPDPNDRVTHTDRDVDDIVEGRNDAATDDRVVEREVVVERDEHPVVADTDTLDHGQHVDPDAEVVVSDLAPCARRSSPARASASAA